MILLEISEPFGSYIFIGVVIAIVILIFWNQWSKIFKLEKQISDLKRENYDSSKEGQTQLKQKNLDFQNEIKQLKLENDSKAKQDQLNFQKLLHEKATEAQKRETDMRAARDNFWREQMKKEMDEFKEKEVRNLATLLLQKWKIEHEALIRADAIARSAAVHLGKITEHFIPFMSNFPYNTKDVRFIGAPIDLIIFDGHAEERDEITIIIVEVKTGNSKLNTQQKKIKDAVMNGRVRWWETKGEDFADNKGIQTEILFKPNK